MSLQMTASLKNALRELYYKEYCDQMGWTYISMKDVDIKGNTLIFNSGTRKISVMLTDKIIPEINEISRSINGNFLFDYLACKVGPISKYDGPMLADPAALCWLKTGKNVFSNDQMDALGRVKLKVARFRIKNVLAAPAELEIKWELKSGEKWLDELDDLKDQAESDDDYF